MSRGENYLDIRPFSSLALDHKVYMVPAYTNVPVCETKTMQVLKNSLGIRRKTVERLRLAQSPGSVFHVKARRDIVLAGLLLAHDYEDVVFNDLHQLVERAIRLMSIHAAPSPKDFMCFVGEGFCARPRGSDRDESGVGFEMLCRSLRKVRYRGIVYEPPEMQKFPSVIPLIEDEHMTDTHTLIGPDGKISPSIPPTMLRSLKKKPA